MNKPTYKQVAESWELWMDYVDPDATMTKEEFDAMTVDERIAMEVDCFGPEQAEDNDDN